MRLRLAIVLALVAAGCTSTSASTTESSTASAPLASAVSTTTTLPPNSSLTTTAPTTTAPRPTTTTTPATTTPSSTTPDPVEELVAVTVTRGIEVPGGIPMDVFAPEVAGPWPAIVLLHGGGWISGRKEDIEPLARRIAGHGAVVFNAGYEVIGNGVFFPETFDQVTCAIRVAAAEAPRYGAAPGPTDGLGDGVVVVGYSAGAHLGALSVFSDGVFDAPCQDLEHPTVFGFVGIAGPYDSDAYPQLLLNFGATRSSDPDLWAAGNPTSYLADRAPVPTLLLHGDLDFVVAPPMSVWFEEALDAAGHPTELVTFADLDHFAIVDVAAAGPQTAMRVARFARQATADG